MIRYFVLTLLISACTSETAKQDRLKDLLGDFPTPPPLKIDTLETVSMEGGLRYKITYLSENQDTILNEPADWINAYLFVPDHQEGDQLPAVIATHQDGSNQHLGKLEPAGLAGDEDQHYGLELYRRGYVVICPDRYFHAERRRIPKEDTVNINTDRDLKLFDFRTGQLLLKGRTAAGKMAYDLSRAVDVLEKLEFVDVNKIGAIGHSGGGMALLYFMTTDSRVKAGVSSCGMFELIDYFGEDAPSMIPGVFAIPGLADVGSNADYLGMISPRPVLLSRGVNEYGTSTSEQKAKSKKHVNSTRNMVAHARKYYEQQGAEDHLKAIYFSEEGGKHAFPKEIREIAYNWLDKHLQPEKQ